VSPEPDPGLLDAVLALVPHHYEGLFVLGICGAQGSGKSTLAKQLLARVEGAAVLSLDDLYLRRQERAELAAQVHPLFATRGVPGTHDIALGLETIASLERGDPARLPRFDKANDDRAPTDTWPITPPGCRLLILEGWCVGARPQPDKGMQGPVNRLEAEEDPLAIWRSHANACLAGEYQNLFSRIDALVLLAAPSFDVVAGWRGQQERDLGSGAAVMDDAALLRFIQHYQRLTEWVLEEMPARADLVVRLDGQRRVQSIG